MEQDNAKISGHIPLTGFTKFPPEVMVERARSYYEMIQSRRSVRRFSRDPIPRKVIDYCLRSAGSAPSGANQQPWHFVVVENSEKKRAIRLAAEKAEREFYEKRAPEDWLNILETIGTNAEKPFLEDAPCLIAVFAENFTIGKTDGKRSVNYYVKESVGLATGFLIAACHHAGLVTLTHTPSPMNFLNEILERPANEKPFLLLVAGFPHKDVTVPDIHRKKLKEISTFLIE